METFPLRTSPWVLEVQEWSGDFQIRLVSVRYLLLAVRGGYSV